MIGNRDIDIISYSLERLAIDKFIILQVENGFNAHTLQIVIHNNK